MSYFTRISAFLGAALLAACSAYASPVEVEVWLTLSPTNQNEFEKLAKQFNNEQSETKVIVKSFANQAALRTEEAKAAAAKRKPNLIQLDDNRSPELIAQHKEIVPLYDLLKQYPIADLNWFLPQTTGFMRNSKQQLLAFPFMAEIPLMFYNIDGYKKAGLDPKKAPATWIALQGDLIALRDKADYECPYGTSQQVSVHLENLASINDVLYVTPDNGLVPAKQPMLNFDSVFMRHLSIMVSWQRSWLFTQNSNGNEADAMFAKNKCAVVTTGSGALGEMLNTRGLNFGVAPLPHYQQVTEKPGSPFVSGSALWAISGHSKEDNKATMSFLAYLSKPVIAAAWHQRTGFLPLTDAAYRTADVAFYDKVPGARNVIESMRAANSSKNSRGFRIKNYPQIEVILSREFDAAISGKTPPVAALNIAMDEAKPLMQDPLAPTKAAPVSKKK